MREVRSFAVVLLLLMGCDVDPSAADGATEDLSVLDFELFPDGANTPLLVPHAAWVAACQTLSACGAWDGQTLSSCIGAEQQPGRSPPLSPPVIDCVRQAGNDCAAVATCLNGGDPRVACDPATEVPGCVGNAITACDFTGTRTAYDCSPFGYVCSGISNAGCGLGPCASGGAACVGGVSGGCASGRLIPRDDCRMYAGASCDSQSGLCKGSGAACTSDVCQGSTQMVCRDGSTAPFDCAQLGLTCVVLFGNVRCGLGTDCTEAFSDSCNGSVLTYCDAGLVKTLDCVAAGWASCSNVGPPTCSP
jgi:hypothetical protein